MKLFNEIDFWITNKFIFFNNAIKKEFIKNIRLKKFFFFNYVFSLQFLDFIFIIFVLIWVFEWFFVFGYLFNLNSVIYIYFPNRIPLFLLVSFIFWVYTWGISVWRRTQYGRFTRGDRKLWIKGFASFWVVEVVTITGILLVSCWMSWGPIVYVPRHVWIPKKGFLFELTLFTYIIWLVYLMRFSLKWQLWRTQFFITLIIILLLFLLIWRDFITLLYRELVNFEGGTNWRHINFVSLLYSISSNWWMESYIGHWKIDKFSNYLPIESVIKNICLNNYLHPFENLVTFKEYESYNWLPFSQEYCLEYNLGFSLEYFVLNIALVLDPGLKPTFTHLLDPVIYTLEMFYLEEFTYSIFFDHINPVNFHGGRFYPRRLGFLPKRIAMWFFLTIIKIWHHFMLFIWWFFYLLRLINRRRSSYVMLSVCYFNVYCCYIIGVLVYLYHVLPFLSLYLKYRPSIQSLLHNSILLLNGLHYCFFTIFGDIFIHLNIKEFAYLNFFNKHKINFIDAQSQIKKNLRFVHISNIFQFNRYNNSAILSRIPCKIYYSNSFFESTVNFYGRKLELNKW